ncbi:MAG: hypothetical protein K8I82_25755, partial [Anaerolineae bacterium]|nr:hypothetical protein [Anaerolineae bacterium]
RLTGFNPDAEQNPLVLLVADGGSALRHLDGEQNPMRTFGAAVGDSVRVESVAPPPTPQRREVEITLTGQQPEKDWATSLTQLDAENLGLFPGIQGVMTFNGLPRNFLMIQAEDYFTAPYADFYLYGKNDLIHLAPHPSTPDAATQLGMQANSTLTLSFDGFAYEEVAAGYITDVQENGQHLLTDVRTDYLESIGITPGSYVNVIINGVNRAALVMDEEMYEASQSPIGLSSNYLLLADPNGLRLIYNMQDGRNMQQIFNADVGSRVWIRPAKAIETIVREEVVVKVVSEIDPTGFFYIDVTPYELSFLTVLLGEYVDVQVNGISYRARVVDDETLNTATPEDDILVYLRNNFIIVTHTVGNTVTAEARYQVSAGDPVVIQRAPN